MAKKQTAASAEATAPETPAAPPAEGATAAPKKTREPKAKEAKDKGSPAAPAPSAPPAAVPTPTPAGGAAPPAAEKKGKKRPGVTPPRGKKLRNQLKNMEQKVAKESPAPLKRAIALLKQCKRAKFDETVEVHMWLGIDTTQNDQMVRGSVALPHGIGKAVRVLVFAQGDNVGKAKEAGADFAGSDDIIKQIQGGW